MGSFGPAPASVVSEGSFTFGRYSTLFADTGMLGAEKPYHYRLPRFIKRFLLEEWQSLAFSDGRWYFFCSIYALKFLGIVEVQAIDMTTGQRHSVRRFLPLHGLGGRIRLPRSLLGSASCYADAQLSLSFHFGIADTEGRQAGTITLEFERRGRKGRSGFRGKFQFEVDSGLAAPSVICFPMSLNRAMYSARILAPFRGSFSAGSGEQSFGDGVCLGLLEDSKGYHPFMHERDAVAGFGVDGRGRRVGFYLSDWHLRPDETQNENCVWIDGEVRSLPPVRITQPNGIGGEWIVQDLDGLVDLVFVPRFDTIAELHALILDASYHRPAGGFRGRIGDGEGDGFDTDRLYGMGEKRMLHL